MIAVRPGRDGGPAHWRLISRTGGSADVLATAPIGGSARGPGWQQAVERLRDGDGDLHITAASDGHYQWMLTDTSGAVIAQSPPAYSDGDSCRQAFAMAQRTARTVLGGARFQPTS
jgi:hypothetical protein